MNPYEQIVLLLADLRFQLQTVTAQLEEARKKLAEKEIAETTKAYERPPLDLKDED